MLFIRQQEITIGGVTYENIKTITNEVLDKYIAGEKVIYLGKDIESFDDELINTYIGHSILNDPITFKSTPRTKEEISRIVYEKIGLKNYEFEASEVKWIYDNILLVKKKKEISIVLIYKGLGLIIP